MRTNAFHEKSTADHKVNEYKNTLQGLLDEFQVRFDDLYEYKPCFAFLVNPFNINVVGSRIVGIRLRWPESHFHTLAPLLFQKF